MDRIQTKELSINIWADIPQIEIWTERGKSFVVAGDDARFFTKMIKDRLVAPILEKPDDSDVDKSLRRDSEKF